MDFDHMDDSMDFVHDSERIDEESGWTAYFEDFSNQRTDEDDDEDEDSFGSSSMVSDAASIPAWNKSTTCRNYSNHVAPSSYSPNFAKKLTFKKTRAKEISHDDSLEDTASSPVNSPKVSDFGVADMNPRKTNDHFNTLMGKGGSLEHYGGVLETNDQRCEMSCTKNINDSTDLKKRGLCLVPLSMLVNYLG